MTIGLANASLTSDASVSAIVNTIDEFGIAVLPGYYSQETLVSLNSEFDEFLSSAKTSNDAALVDRPELTALPVVRNKIDVERFPVTFDVFSDQMMREVSTQYLKTQEIGLNHQIYVNLNNATNSPVDKLPFLPHFDKIFTFKFFIYLTDTSEKNGAMGVIPGTQIANRKVRMDSIKSGEPTSSIQNVVDGKLLIPVEGVAGTMFIFDTDVAHGAGYVQDGMQRRIMRGHTRTVEGLEALGLAQQAF